MGDADENEVSTEKEAFICVFLLQRVELTMMPTVFFCYSEGVSHCSE